jgi:hypothetical protein
LYSQNDKDIFDDYKQYFFQRMTSVKLWNAARRKTTSYVLGCL